MSGTPTFTLSRTYLLGETFADGVPVPEPPAWQEFEWCDHGASCEHAACLGDLAAFYAAAEEEELMTDIPPTDREPELTGQQWARRRDVSRAVSQLCPDCGAQEYHRRTCPVLQWRDREADPSA